jgi:hypothetical protein
MSFNGSDLTFGNKINWRPKRKASPSQSDLPLYYKDKAANHNQKPSPKLVMLIKGFVFSMAMYIVYFYARHMNDAEPYLFFGGGSGQVDWALAKQEVKDVFLESWASYETYAWGKDVFHPISQSGENMGPKPLGWMIVDSLDTLMIMDCPEQLNRAHKWVKEELNYNFNYNVNVFETTIRMLGGLLSAHHLSGDDLYLDRAADLANALLGGFKSPTGIPFASVNLETGEGVESHVDGGASSTAEVATLQLEFKYLAKLTGEANFWEHAEKVMQVLDANKPQDGLVPIYVNPKTGKYQGRLIRLGSRGDSYYEYLLKQYLQTNNEEQIYLDMYRESVKGVKKHMIGKSKPSGLTYVGELDQGIAGSLSSKMDHLVCFYGGLLALGATNGLTLKEARQMPTWNTESEADFKLGEDLTYTCYRMYHDIEETGLAPEIVVFNKEETVDKKDFFIKPLDRHNLQRPETVESLFYLYRLTKDPKYREWGYEIFQNFVEHAKVVDANGVVSYTSLNDITKSNPADHRDNMESFWLAETLKYLYLLFDDTNQLPLDKYVFNTEAHPFPRFDMEPLFKTGWSRDFDDERRLKSLQDLMRETKVDKKHPPDAVPANKPIDEQVKEVAKENPEILQESERLNREKMQEILHAT